MNLNRALWKKTLGEAQWLWLALAVLLFAFCWIRVWVVTFFETSRFQKIVEQFWDDYQRFFTVSLAELLSYPVRIGMTYVEPIVLVVVGVWAIARGSAAVSGEISRGTMEMLLAQPVGRLQAYFAQSAVTTLGGALLAFVSWIGVWVGIEVNSVKIEGPPPSIRLPYVNLEIPLPFAEREMQRMPMSSQVEARRLAPAAFNLFALGFCMAGVATLVSAADRYRWRTIGLATGVLLVQFIMKGFAVAAPSLEWMKRFTLFTPYEPMKWVSLEARHPGAGWSLVYRAAAEGPVEWGPLANNGVLLGIGLAAYVLGAVIFVRRDLPAPL